MVKAGQPVDDTIQTLQPHLQSGDMVIDAGNSHPARNRAALEASSRPQGCASSAWACPGARRARSRPEPDARRPRKAAYDELEPMLARSPRRSTTVRA
jgi:6-phosphogluconate dehydrogenase